MNIRTKIRIGTVVIGIFVVCIVSAIVIIAIMQQTIYQKGLVAEQISEATFQLAAARVDYVKNPTDRGRDEWIHSYEDLSRVIENSTPFFTVSPEKELFEEMQTSFNETHILFDKTVDELQHGGNPAVIEDLRTQLSKGTQTRMFDSLHLMEISWRRTSNLSRIFIFIDGVMAVIIIGISLYLFNFSRKISDSMHELREGMGIIAAGDLSHQLDVQSGNEFGDVARLFNIMAARLGESNRTLEERVTERTVDLKKTNIFLDAIIENIPNMIFLKDAKDLRFARFNKAGEKLLGYPREQLIGKNDYDFFPKDQADFFIKKDRAVLDGGMLVDIPEEPLQTKDNGTRILHTKKIPLLGDDGEPQYLLGISADITEQKKNERELKIAYDRILEESGNSRKFQQAVNAATDAIAITLPDLTYVYVNPAWETLTGYTAKDVLGKLSTFVLSEKMDPAITQKMIDLSNIAQAKSGAIFHSDLFIHRRKDGTEYNVEKSVYPILEGDHIVFYVLMHRNITQRMRDERAKSEFISLASHQLRTPLTEIRWALSNLESDTLDERHRNIIGTAHKAASHMADTIRTMLTISHIEAEEIHPEISDVRLKKVFDSTLSLHERHRAQKNIHVFITDPDDAVLRTDEQFLGEILANLLSNAYKYTPPDGSVRIAAVRHAADVIITVTDTGFGIPVLEQSRLFTKFFRASNVVDKEEAGSGIGLYMVYSLVTLLGGKISFTSEENKGTTFTLIFPTATI